MKISPNGLCMICGNKLLQGQKAYCSKNCNHKAYYRRNVQMFVDKAREYDLKHPIKAKQWQKKAAKKYYNSPKGKSKLYLCLKRDYEKNKYKWACRKYTRVLLKRKVINIIKKCKICDKNTNLQIHHELYSKSKEDIIRDVNEGKIYYLCRNHHKTSDGHKHLQPTVVFI